MNGTEPTPAMNHEPGIDYLMSQAEFAASAAEFTTAAELFEAIISGVYKVVKVDRPY